MSTSVSYRARFTRNMGNFESLQLEIGVESDTLKDESAAKAYERVKDFVDERLLTEIDQLERDIKNARAAVKDD